MAFIPFSGKTQVIGAQKTASTAMSVGDLLINSSGTVSPAAAGNTTQTFGVSLRKVVSADSDYSSTTVIPVVMLTPDLVFKADVGAGTATIANVGLQYDLAAAGTVDLTATTHKNVTVVGFTDSTHVLVTINSSLGYKNVS